jgi:hypothetical protein
MSITLIQNGMLAVDAVNLNNLSTYNAPETNTFLSGSYGWLFQDSYYFDMGQINIASNNMIQLLLAMSPIDFNNASIGFDAGQI